MSEPPVPQAAANPAASATERVRALAEALSTASALAALAALLAGAALALYLGWGRPQAQRLEAVQARLQASGQGVTASAAPAPQATARAQLDAFYAGFPALPEAAEALGRLQAAARRHDIQLLAGEYRLEQRPGEALQRYTLVLPLRGRYPPLRAFVDAALRELPHAALDDLALRREDGAQPELDARLRLTLYLRATP